MSVFKCLLKVFVSSCVFIEFNCFAIYQYPSNWNSWIMLPASGRTKDNLSVNSVSNNANIPIKSASIPIYYDFTAQKETSSNISEPFFISIKSGKSLQLIPKNRMNNEPRKDLDKVIKNESDISLTNIRNFTWNKIVKSAVKLLESYLFEDFSHQYFEGRQQGRAKEKSFKGKKLKVRKQYKKFMLPLLLAYKLKFFTLIPVLIGGLVLLVGSTGMAGFFFALFAAVMSLKSEHKATH